MSASSRLAAGLPLAALLLCASLVSPSYAQFTGDYNQGTGAVYDGGAEDGAHAITIDDSTSTLVVGYTAQGANGNDWLIVRYSSEGVLNASATWNSGAGTDDRLEDEFIGSDLYVAGRAAGTERRIAKYGSEVSELASFQGGAGYFEGVLEVGASVYATSVIGATLNVNLFSQSLALLSTNTVIPGDFAPGRHKRNLGADLSGSVYVVGVCTTTNQIVVQKYNPDLTNSAVPTKTIADATFFTGATMETVNDTIYVTAVSSDADSRTHVYKLDTNLTVVSSTSFQDAGPMDVYDQRALSYDAASARLYVTGSGNFPGLVSLNMFLGDKIELGTADHYGSMKVVTSSSVYVSLMDESGDFKSKRLNANSVGGESEGAGGGRAIALGMGEMIWEVVPSSPTSTLILTKFSAAGAPMTSVTLPDASYSWDMWSIVFDGNGTPFVIGVASGPYTVGEDVVVYQASPAGGAILSSATYNSPEYNLADYVTDAAMDSAGNIWMTGAVQVGAGEEFAWALFKASGTLLTRTTTYAGGIGMGIGVSGSDELWVVGLSSTGANPQLPVDLELYKYAADGMTLAGGPYVRTGYAADFEGNARIAVDVDALYVAANIANAPHTNLDLAFLKYDVSGSTVVEKYWHSESSTGTEMMFDIAFDNNMDVLIAGSVDVGSGPAGALWKYDQAGNFVFAKTVGGHSEANAIAVNSSAEIWLAVTSSGPYHWTAGSDLSGAEGLEGAAGGTTGTFSGDFDQASGALYDGGDEDSLRDLAIDTITAGGPYVYVVGASSLGANGEDWLAIKYSSTGVLRASATFDAGGADYIWNAALDQSGFLYATGKVTPNVVRMVKYGPDLVEVSSTIASIGEDLAVTGDGSAVLNMGFQGSDMVLVKRDGNLVWVASTVVRAAGYIGVHMATDDSADSVYLSVEAEGDAYLELHKYSISTLAFVSSTTYALWTKSRGGDLAVDSSGNVFVVGVATDGVTAMTTVAKFDSSLAFISSAPVLTTSSMGCCSRIVVDKPTGEVYVTRDRVDRLSNNLASYTYNTTLAGGFIGGIGVIDSTNVYVAGVRDNDAFTKRINLTYTAEGGGGSGDVRTGGYAVAIDGSGNIWEVIAASDVYRLSKHDSAGVFVSSVALPGAAEDEEFWNIAFDGAGNVYAIGTASGALTVSEDLVVYKVPSSGDVVMSSRTYNNSSYDLDEIGIHAATGTAGNIWITGAIQTGGSWETDDVTFLLGVWKYDTTTDSLTLTTTYAGPSAMDAGFGIAVNAANEKWVIGYSSDNANAGDLKLDLALWKFDAAGTGLTAGPFTLPGYMYDLDHVGAKVAVTPSAVYAAATRLSEAADSIDLAFVKYDLAGSTQVLKFWHSTSASADDVPEGVALDSGGNMYITGSKNVESGTDALAVWKYDSAGNLLFAKTVESEEQGRDIAIAGSGDIWLATRQSALPLNFIEGSATDLSGAEGLDAGPQPPTSAITFPAHNATVPNLMTISGTAADETAVTEVRVSIQRVSDGFYFDGAGYNPAQTWSLAAGTATWVLSSPIAVNTGTGTFVIVSRARDDDTNYQTAFTVGVASISVNRQPVRPTSPTIVSRTSGTITISWNANGNPPDTQFNVGIGTSPTGQCIGYVEGLFQGGGNTAQSTFTLTNHLGAPLLPGTTYIMSVCTPDVPQGQESCASYLVAATREGTFSGTENNPSYTACAGGWDSGGFAVATDDSGNIWEIAAENESFWLAKHDSAGVFVSSVALPGADADSMFSIEFDLSGNAYAIGAASSSFTVGEDLAVYRVNSAGNVLVASATYNDAVYNLDEFSLGSDADASGNIWIAGYIQRYQGVSPNEDDERSDLGLWKFDTATNLLSLTTSYTGTGGAEAGFDIQVDAQDKKWIIGYSSNPANPGPDKLDLTLWEYDAAGTASAGGPFRLASYLNTYDDPSARLVLSGSSLYAAGQKINSARTSVDLAFVQYDLTGSTQVLKYWHSTSPSRSEEPDGIALDSSGNVYISGRPYMDSGTNELAVWKYDQSGNFVFAKTVANHEQGRGIAISGTDEVWLATQLSTAPFKFIEGTAAALSGAEGEDPGPVPPTSAILYPAHNSTVPNLMTISGTAADNSAVTEVRVSIQRMSDGMYFDGTTYGATPMWILAAGTANWVLTSTFTVNTGTGTFSIVSRARDDESNYQTAFTVGVASISVTRQPVRPTSATIVSRTSGTITISWDANGNPPDTQFTVGIGTSPTGQCIGYVDGLFQGGGNTTETSFTLTNHLGAPLLPGTTYIMSVCTPDVPQGQESCAGYVVTATREVTFSGTEATPPFTACASGGGDNGGFAVAIDGSGNIWEVLADYGDVRLSKHDSAGVFVSSTALPDADDEAFTWNIEFDGSDNAYAVGTASGPATHSLDLAVYKVAASGSVLLASATYNDPAYNLEECSAGVGRDSSGNLWLAGFIQTGGSWETDDATYALALWKYNATTGLLSRTTAYFGPSDNDFAFDIAIDGADEKWLIGFSSNSANAGVAKMDLALWKYNATGTGLTAGPFLLPGYMHDLEDIDAKLALSTSAIYAAASRYSAAGDTQDLAFIKYDLAGSTQVVKTWHSESPSRTDIPSGMALDSSGNVYVAGEVDIYSGTDEVAVWKYDQAGSLLFAKTVANQEESHGIAISGTDEIWLATEMSSAPFKFIEGAATALTGAEGLDDGSGPALVHAKGAQEFVIAETDEDEMAGFHSVAFDGTNFLVAYSNINSTTSV
ncbi:MAG: SBBP repeat-containing protein, partial [Elusimicrobiota bacterium]